MVYYCGTIKPKVCPVHDDLIMTIRHAHPLQPDAGPNHGAASATGSGSVRRQTRFARLLAIVVLQAPLVPASVAGDSDEAVAISAAASGDYTRTRLPDGSYKPETFVFGNGGVIRGTEGGTKDLLDFMDVAKVMAPHLASQGYHSSADPTRTDLLIMVYWGTTRTPESRTNSQASQNLASASAAALAANHPEQVHFNPNDTMAPQQMATSSTGTYALRSPAQVDLDNAFSAALSASAAEDKQRLMLDYENAKMLGFDSDLVPEEQSRGTALEFRTQDLIGELEEHRYFVVLMAYDFSELWKHKRHKLLWEVRFSIRERNDDISKALEGMAASASAYFGKNTGRLVRAPMPEGHVEVGPLKTIPMEQHQ